MEGRRPPPYAEHPYPKDPDLYKIFGTPLTKPFFKTCAVTFVTLITYNVLQYFARRNTHGVFGDLDLCPKDPELLFKRLDILEKKAKLFNSGDLRMHTNDTSEGDGRFDDSAQIIIPTKKQVEKAMIWIPDS